MRNIIEFFRKFKDNIGEPPWDYNFLINLDESEYPKYLAKIFNYSTGEKLPLSFDFHKNTWIIDKKRCKTFNQKIQWIKLNFRRVESPNSILGARTRSNKKSAETHKGVNGIIDTFGSRSKDFNEENSEYYNLVRKCTDKVAVRDYVAEKIGEEYLKPALQIIGNCSPSTSGRGRGEGIPLAENDVSTYFEQINWKKLPNAFVIKCNHGCKWHYIIKDKKSFLENERLFNIVKQQMIGWLEQDYSFFGGFEMQYITSLTAERKGCQEKGIEPKILIEPLMRDEINIPCEEIQVYCFSGLPRIYIKIYSNSKSSSIWDENFNYKEDIFKTKDELIKKNANELVKKASYLSSLLSKSFNFVRVDWMIYDNKLFFEELTFTPYCGFLPFSCYKENIKFSNWLNF